MQVLTDGVAPVWLAPLLTGLFVLAAALITAGIAFLSLRASDRRKLEREDRRQWDNELKAAYVTIAAQVSEVRKARASGHPVAGTNPGLLTVAAAALIAIREQTLLFELIAPPPVIAAGKKVSEGVLTIWQYTLIADMNHEEGDRHLNWSVADFEALDGYLLALRGRLREALRLHRVS
ncbi:hypothetical protein [Curtobacterium flaccumfaciens]|uniref:hypothetical protein n=1 Tax=Curtobacterium flaccumfaciens TaxID=2035 RepID=UPI001BDE135B|nr:hypothetical protein [Curtobacterium flaccumfaciens]MBT1631519.1 hypothetical protein [Curtobacterium flaccumfaciens pv. oortii]MCX2846827.1 hypothetical protein [Curtobacterium flaccumfaciens pv. oortii]